MSEPPKKKRGRPRKNPLPEPTPEVTQEAAPEEAAIRTSLEMAHAIMWAIEWAKKGKAAVTRKQKNISPLQWAYWELGQENYKDLVVNLGRQAKDTLDKYAASQVDDDVVAAEQEAVKEIDELLQAAIEEARSC